MEIRSTTIMKTFAFRSEMHTVQIILCHVRNFNLWFPLNSSHKNTIEYKNFSFLEFFKYLFRIFKKPYTNKHYFINTLESFLKIWNKYLQNSKNGKCLYPLVFSYDEFNRNHKLKFRTWQNIIWTVCISERNANIFIIVLFY